MMEVVERVGKPPEQSGRRETSELKAVNCFHQTTVNHTMILSTQFSEELV
jgi:hypothetical protein